jgi:hypothetical protein
MSAEEKKSKKDKTPEFPNRAAEELYWAKRQFLKSITIIVVLSIILYITHFLSGPFTLLFFFIGFILWLATFTYTVGHFVRYFVFKSKNL